MKFETLENRLLLYAVTGYEWADTDVSVSFIPGELFDELDAIAPTEVWQGEFDRALQTWADVSPLTFHFVADTGAPSGASGDVQGDPRFGDIRLGAAPRTDSYVAYAYYPSTWSTLGGDISLNSGVTFHVGTPLDLYSALLHEIGHSIGLGHSTSDTIMSPYISGVYTTLTPDDIAGVQAIYGDDPPEPPTEPPEPPAEFEPDRFEPSTIVDLGTFNNRTLTGLTIHDDTDEDTYRFRVKTAGTYRVTIADTTETMVLSRGEEVTLQAISEIGEYDLIVSKLRGRGRKK